MLQGDWVFAVWMGGLVVAYLLGSHEGRINLVDDLLAGKTVRVGNRMVNIEAPKKEE